MTVTILSVDQAAVLVKSGQTVIVGGFGVTGYPTRILNALADTDVTNLTYISNNVGEPGIGGGLLLRRGRISKAIGSFFTSNREAVEAHLAGDLEVELIPQGDLAEALRAGGAGIGGYYTPTGAGTELATGRETRIIDGIPMVLVKPLRGDVALIRAWKADRAGNLQYRMTENNFNQAAATAADLVIAEVEHIVEVGDLDPNFIHTPGCLVDVLVESKLEPSMLGSSADVAGSRKKVDVARMAIARAALDELRPGEVVNLGVGIPTLVADLITAEHRITLHSENGMLGVGPEPETGGAMDYPINASKVPVTAMPGASYFDSATSFALIRGGHIDTAIIGGLQVDEQANLANWAIPGKPLLGVGGAMDLAIGARRLIIAMTHNDRDGSSKLVPDCTLPLTAAGVVDVVITELGVFKFRNGRLTLVKLQPGHSVEEIQQHTEADFDIDL
ncbi:MAG: 3-oxoacid CoA-transferase [Gammaproteobacteria bacterium]|nr:3-oxoacid CoA-transferase subunit B [Pseudomonadales bacterium]